MSGRCRRNFKKDEIMCGIAGFWGPSASTETLIPILKGMAHALAHRGPDGNGTHCEPADGVGFAHSRLAIVDLSPAGHQPMLSENGRFQITYNGEIYNYMEIRRELEDAGAAPHGGWRGHCDTEVLLAALQIWGVERTLSRCVGMFAFAFFDKQEKTLTLGRDRLGIKPLYLGYRNNTLLFGSELSALRVHPAWNQGGAPGVSAPALEAYLRYSCVPAPLTIYKGVYKLVPGSYVTFGSNDIKAQNMPRAVRYWSVERCVAQGRENPLQGDAGELADRLEHALRDAVQLRLVADVPLGAFLSGGVDSSTITALMQELSSQPVRTFSIGSRSAQYNEADQARAVAEHLGTHHTELIVDPAEALAAARKMPEIFDEPYADVSQIPTWLVSKLARQDVTVCLSGDGGDELFGGYNRYFHAPELWEKIGALPQGVRKPLAALMRGAGEGALSALYGVAANLRGKKGQPLFRDKLQKVVEALPAKGREGFFQSLIATWQQPRDLLDASFAADAPAVDPVAAALAPEEELPEAMEFAPWMMAMDQNGYLPDDILTKMDRASMAVALEGRVPLLDHRVVELAWRMPLWAKIEGRSGKKVLRDVLHRKVPRELVERPKQGFDLPVDAWLRKELKDWAGAHLGKKSLEDGGLDPDPVLQAWREHQQGRRNRHWQLWSVLMYQAWRGAYTNTSEVEAS